MTPTVSAIVVIHADLQIGCFYKQNGQTPKYSK